MQVQNNPQIPNTVPNFKAIKSVKHQGLYKKHPKLAQNLVDTFKTNKTAMDFCKKYDVDIVFDACKDIMDSVKSSVAIFFKNPAKTKCFGLISNVKDSIIIHGYGNKYNIPESLKEGTKNLELHIIEEGTREGSTGILTGNIKYKNTQIDELLGKKHTNKMTVDELRESWETAELQNSIDELIKQSK